MSDKTQLITEMKCCTTCGRANACTKCPSGYDGMSHCGHCGRNRFPLIPCKSCDGERHRQLEAYDYDMRYRMFYRRAWVLVSGATAVAALVFSVVLAQVCFFEGQTSVICDHVSNTTIIGKQTLISSVADLTIFLLAAVFGMVICALIPLFVLAINEMATKFPDASTRRRDLDYSTYQLNIDVLSHFYGFWTITAPHWDRIFRDKPLMK